MDISSVSPLKQSISSNPEGIQGQDLSKERIQSVEPEIESLGAVGGEGVSSVPITERGTETVSVKKSTKKRGRVPLFFKKLRNSVRAVKSSRSDVVETKGFEVIPAHFLEMFKGTGLNRVAGCYNVLCGFLLNMKGTGEEAETRRELLKELSVQRMCIDEEINKMLVDADYRKGSGVADLSDNERKILAEQLRRKMSFDITSVQEAKEVEEIEGDAALDDGGDVAGIGSFSESTNDVQEVKEVDEIEGNAALDDGGDVAGIGSFSESTNESEYMNINIFKRGYVAGIGSFSENTDESEYMNINIFKRGYVAGIGSCSENTDESEYVDRNIFKQDDVQPSSSFFDDSIYATMMPRLQNSDLIGDTPSPSARLVNSSDSVYDTPRSSDPVYDTPRSSDFIDNTPLDSSESINRNVTSTKSSESDDGLHWGYDDTSIYEDVNYSTPSKK